MLVCLLTSFVDVVAAVVAIEKVHQMSFFIVIVLRLARVSSYLVDSRLCPSSVTVFNCLLNNILSSVMRVSSGRQVTLSILSLLNILLNKYC
jgi:hypothetical protein